MVNDPVVDRVISGAPSADAVTWKLNGERSVVDALVSETVTSGRPAEPGVTSPGLSGMLGWEEVAGAAGCCLCRWGWEVASDRFRGTCSRWARARPQLRSDRYLTPSKIIAS